MVQLDCWYRGVIVTLLFVPVALIVSCRVFFATDPLGVRVTVCCTGS